MVVCPIVAAGLAVGRDATGVRVWWFEAGAVRCLHRAEGLADGYRDDGHWMAGR